MEPDLHIITVFGQTVFSINKQPVFYWLLKGHAFVYMVKVYSVFLASNPLTTRFRAFCRSSCSLNAVIG